MEGPDEVRGCGCVDPRLTADARVRRSKDGCRDVHERHSPGQGRRDETCQVGHNAPTDCQDAGVPTASGLYKSVLNGGLRLPGLVLFASPERHDMGTSTTCGQLRPNGLGHASSDVLIGDDRHLVVDEVGLKEPFGDYQGEVVSDHDRIRLVDHSANRHADCGQGDRRRHRGDLRTLDVQSPAPIPNETESAASQKPAPCGSAAVVICFPKTSASEVTARRVHRTP
jgi:hypothetical protein